MKRFSRVILQHSLALAVITLPACPSLAAMPDKVDEFASSPAMQDQELAKARGGFSLPSGAVVHFTYTSSLNGVTQTQFSSDDLANAIRINTQNRVNEALAKAGIAPPVSSDSHTNNNNTAPVNTVTTQQTTSITPDVPPPVETPAAVTESNVPPVQNPVVEAINNATNTIPDADVAETVHDAINDTVKEVTEAVQPPVEVANVGTPHVTEPTPVQAENTTNEPTPPLANNAPDITPQVQALQQSIDLTDLVSNVVQNNQNDTTIQLQQTLDMTVSNTQLVIDSQAVNNTLSQAALMNSLAIK